MEYKYRGIDSGGKVVKGLRIGENPWSVIEELKEEGISCLKCELRESSNNKLYHRKASYKDLSLLCRTMKNNLKSGIPITNSLKLSSRHIKNKELALVLKSMVKNIEAGGTLTDAFNKNDDMFSEFFISMVNIGEKSGNLEEIFKRLEIYAEREGKRNKSIISITMYPAFIFTASIIAALVIIVKFLPKFFSNMNINIKEMPFITRFYMSTAEVLSGLGFLVVPIFVLLLIIFNTGYSKFKKSSYFEKLKYKSIITKGICTKGFCCRFTMALHMIIESGLDIKGAFHILKDGESSSFIRGKYIRAIEELEVGEVLSNVIRNFGLFPDEFLVSIYLGEENGTLDETLWRYNEIFEEDIKNGVDRIIKVIEPLLVLAAGLFILSIYIAIMVPLYSIYTV